MYTGCTQVCRFSNCKLAVQSKLARQRLAHLGYLNIRHAVVHDIKTSRCLLNIIIIPGLGEHGHAWYINGELAPDLYLAKGIQYTFIVEVGYTVHIHSEGRLYSKRKVYTVQ